MSFDSVVVNSSPLICLIKIGRESLLPALFKRVVVPNAVFEEITTGGHGDLPAKKLPGLSWLVRESISEIPDSIISWDLGKGETQVLSFAFHNMEFCPVLDDKTARRCARANALPFVGTGGLLLAAKLKGLLPSVTEAIFALKSAGLWLSNEHIKLLKEKAGEE